jgi:hypothetical protein
VAAAIFNKFLGKFAKDEKMRHLLPRVSIVRDGITGVSISSK